MEVVNLRKVIENKVCVGNLRQLFSYSLLPLVLHTFLTPQGKLTPRMADETLVETKTSFGSFSHMLDARILRALADMGFAHPTLIQAKSIPLALENRDILARARTGSGKTAAYCVPLVQKILNAKPAVGAPLSICCIMQGLTTVASFRQNGGDDIKATRGLILVPTKELAEQVTRHLRQLTAYLDQVSLANAASGTTAHLQRCVSYMLFCFAKLTPDLSRAIMSERPDIVVATPSRILSLLQSKVGIGVISVVFQVKFPLDHFPRVLRVPGYRRSGSDIFIRSRRRYPPDIRRQLPPESVPIVPYECNDDRRCRGAQRVDSAEPS